MQSELIRSIDLPNGLVMELHDASRRVAADRWRIELVVRIPIGVSETWFSQKIPPPDSLQTIRSSLGETIVFEYRKLRNFIGADEKDAVSTRMQEELMDTALAYYAHPDFAARFIIKTYLAHQKTSYRKLGS